MTRTVWIATWIVPIARIVSGIVIRISRIVIIMFMITTMVIRTVARMFRIVNMIDRIVTRMVKPVTRMDWIVTRMLDFYQRQNQTKKFVWAQTIFFVWQ